MEGDRTMRKGKVAGIAAAALVAGLVLGTWGVASAAPQGAGSGVQGFGMRVGAIVREAGGTLADAVAKLTGLTADDVREQRQDGASFADIAKAEGVGTDAVVDSALSVRKTALDEAVKSGRITQAQADEMLEHMEERLTDRVDSTEPGCDGSGAGGGGGRGFGGGHGACYGAAAQ
jgi:hypothetical protein